MKKYAVLIFGFVLLGSIVGKAQYRVLLYCNVTNGQTPYGALMLTQNRLYDMTYTGGIHGLGNIFSIDTNGGNYKDIFDFDNYPYGSNPVGGLILSGDTLFGTTETGGGDVGVVFSVDSTGAGMRNLVSFYDNNGANPECTLVKSGSVLYGMAISGGGYGYGNIFTVNTNGSGFTDLLDFDITNGRYTYSSLALSGNVLFGMTYQGGLNDLGTVFSIHTDGSHYKLLLNFDSANGRNPHNTLLISGSKLFGVASNGGLYDLGCIFSMDTNGSNYKDLYNFNGFNGSAPDNLLLSGNLLYGTTAGGGAYNFGCIYSIDTDGTNYKHLFDFESVKGSNPFAGLIISGNVFYGTTGNGGPYNSGVVFSFIPCSFISSSHTVNNVNCNGINNGSAFVTPGGGVPPYTYIWSPDGGTDNIVTGLSAGNYTVTITDSNGCESFDTIAITQPPAFNVITHNDTAINGCNGSAWLTLTGGTPPYTYAWGIGGTSDSISNLCGGVYCCFISDANGCRLVTDSVCDSVPTLTSTSLNYLLNTGYDISVYPNPSAGIFTIQSSVVSGQWSVEVFNVLGEKVYSAAALPLNPHAGTFPKGIHSESELDLRGQPNGVYFYRVLGEDGTILGNGKLIINK